MSPVELRCPSCQSSFRVPTAPPAGGMVCCPQCQHWFATPGAEPAAADLPEVQPLRRAPAARKRGNPLLLPLAILAGVLLVTLVALAGAYYAGVAGLFNDTNRGPAPVVTRPGPAGTRAASFDDWLQDLEEAKQRAAAGKKDILIAFDGSDWCPWSVRLADEVLLHPNFQNHLTSRFVPVFIDIPQTPAAKAKVKDPSRNQELVRRFRVSQFPTLVLCDDRARPYGVIGYLEGGAQPYIEDLNKLQEIRRHRDGLLAAVESAEGAARLAEARKALQGLQQQGALMYFEPEAAGWLKLAEEHDPNNRDRYLEEFFEAHWNARASLADKKDLPASVAALEDWKKDHDFADANRAARMHLSAARLLGELERFDEALAYLDAGLGCRPTDPQLTQLLTNGTAVLGLGTGTGFAVAPGGYVLTNAHVVPAGCRVFVHLPQGKKLVPARALAHEQARDLALLKLDLPKDADLPALAVADGQQPKRGGDVAVLGYPLGRAYGAGLKLTRGGVSALPEPGNNNLLMLDVKINPGNSGSPLCDAAGNVVGVVTARTLTQFGSLESYGMAVPAADALAFLRKHCPGYQEGPAADKTAGWDEVDRRVGPSVVLIVTAPPPQPAQAQPQAQAAPGR